MAPRGRLRRKNRNTRMDGAIEAMTKEYGFSDEELVRKVAKQLLQEYGGEDGWYFIEQYSYKELLEALLRYQNQIDEEKPDKRDDFPENCSLEGDKAEEHALTDVAQPSGVVAEATCSEMIKNELETSNQDDKNFLPTSDRYGKSWKDIVLDQASSQRNKADPSCDNDEKSNTNEDGAKSSILAPKTPVGNTQLPPDPSPWPKISTPPPPVCKFPSKRRQPCYGWIESDEEDADDVFIELTPAADWEDLKPAKRTSRWDLRPEDP